MAKQVINNGESGLVVRTKLNENFTELYDDKANTADLATVATTGSYDDLTNKPTIPPAAPVDSVNGQTGVVLLDGEDIPVLQGGPLTVTQAITDLGNTTLQEVTDNGNLTTNPIVTPSVNGAAITSSGAGGNLYLDDNGGNTQLRQAVVVER